MQYRSYVLYRLVSGGLLSYPNGGYYAHVAVSPGDHPIRQIEHQVYYQALICLNIHMVEHGGICRLRDFSWSRLVRVGAVSLRVHRMIMPVPISA